MLQSLERETWRITRHQPLSLCLNHVVESGPHFWTALTQTAGLTVCPDPTRQLSSRLLRAVLFVCLLPIFVITLFDDFLFWIFIRCIAFPSRPRVKQLPMPSSLTSMHMRLLHASHNHNFLHASYNHNFN